MYIYIHIYLSTDWAHNGGNFHPSHSATQPLSSARVAGADTQPLWVTEWLLQPLCCSHSATQPLSRSARVAGADQFSIETRGDSGISILRTPCTFPFSTTCMLGPQGCNWRTPWKRWKKFDESTETKHRVWFYFQLVYRTNLNLGDITLIIL